jgi:hypothetical protein
MRSYFALWRWWWLVCAVHDDSIGLTLLMLHSAPRGAAQIRGTGRKGSIMDWRYVHSPLVPRTVYRD